MVSIPPSLRLSPVLILTTVALGMLCGGTAHGQTHVLSPVSGSAVPGGAVAVPILLENSEPVRGFSLGVAHDGAILSLAAITEGAALLAANSGTGPDFFFQEIAPAGGAGGTCGAVLSFQAPLDDIAPGIGNELAIYQYVVHAAAAPGNLSPITVTDVLGDPVLETIISVAGVTRIPMSTPAQVSVDTPPVTQVNCALVDPCLCEFEVTWTNAAAYDSISVLVDGVVVESLAGSATATTLEIGATTIGGPESATISVVPRLNTVEAVAENCVASCPDIPDPIAPIGFSCSVDSLTGAATALWSNGQNYSRLELSLVGGQGQLLNGGAVTTGLNLGLPGTYELCLQGFDQCDVPTALVCCTVVYEQIFDRGDANVDSAFNISDPIFALNFLFGGGPLPCAKAADFNDTGDVNIADIVHGLQAIFGVGAQPGAPFGVCGVDPTADALTCGSFAACP